MERHTPGPWTADYDEAEDQIIIWGEDERVIARTDWADQLDIANSELIAKAPDLLAENDELKKINAELVEGLKAVVKEGSRPNNEYDNSTYVAFKNAAALIAKASSIK